MADLTLAPPPYQTVFDNAGTLVPNACIWTYVAGTTTPAVTYSDALGTPNTNPIRADSAGRFTAYLEPGAGYRFVYELPATPPAHGAVLRTADNIVGALTSAAWTSGTWLPNTGGNATYTTQEGTWVRVGPLVVARGRLTIGTIGTGSPFAVFGLPFPVAGEAAGTLVHFIGLNGTWVWLGVRVEAGTTDFVFEGLPSAAGTSPVASILTNGSAITFTVSYLTTAP